MKKNTNLTMKMIQYGKKYYLHHHHLSSTNRTNNVNNVLHEVLH